MHQLNGFRMVAQKPMQASDVNLAPGRTRCQDISNFVRPPVSVEPLKHRERFTILAGSPQSIGHPVYGHDVVWIACQMAPQVTNGLSIFVGPY